MSDHSYHTATDHNLGDPRETPDEREIRRLGLKVVALTAERDQLRADLARANAIIDELNQAAIDEEFGT